MRIETFLVPFTIALALTPLVRKVATKYGWFAPTNERTVHRGNVVRIGGIAIYLAFVASLLLFFEFNQLMVGMLAGGTVIFATGLIDDIYNIKPMEKLLLQIISALIVVFVGDITLERFNLPFGLVITNDYILQLITFCWVVGVTNAINLIDGLDGLAAGICLIVLITLSTIAISFMETGTLLLAIVLIGAIAGFIPYNFYPASIFLGDCGSQLLGFLISVITIISFKSTAFITLMLPFAMLFVPLIDTFAAIIRRKSKGKKITEADKSHLHHILMFDLKLGHRKTVLVLYGVSAVFGATAFLYRYDSTLGAIVLVFLMLLFEIFIEYTGMINVKYRPILYLFEKLSINKEHHTPKSK